MINKKNVIKLVFLFILFYFSRLFEYIPAYIFNIDIKNISSTTNILLSIFSNLCLLIILLVIYRKDLLNYSKKLKKTFMKSMDKSLLYYLFFIFGMVILNLLLGIIIKTSGPNNEKLVQEMITASPYLMIINAGFIAPIIEELVFRKSFMDTFKNKWLFVIISGFVFGFVHVINTSTTPLEYLYFLPYMSLGVSFALMDYEEKNVLPSIIFHMAHYTILILISII